MMLGLLGLGVLALISVLLYLILYAVSRLLAWWDERGRRGRNACREQEERDRDG